MNRIGDVSQSEMTTIAAGGARAARARVFAKATQSQAVPLRVGIVGMGKMGRIRARVVNAHPDLELVAVCDVSEESLTDFNDQEHFRDYRALLTEDLDVVFACVYNGIAPSVVVHALDQGKHVFCEKPPGRNVEDVEHIIAAERRNPDLKLQFGFNHRYHYAVLEAKAIVDSRRFGDVLWMRGTYGKAGGIQFENSWRNDAHTAGGGILLDQGIHMLDLFRFMAGDFPHVQSHVTTSFWNIPMEDNAFAILHNSNGQVALLHSSATQWKHKFSLEMCLEEGYLNLNGILSSTRSYGDESITFARRQFEDEAFAFGKPREETVYFDRDDSWSLEIDDFVRAIRDGSAIRSGNSSDALHVMKLVDTIYRQAHK